MNTVEISKLRKTYGDKTVLDIDALEIAEGELVGLVGNNGAGKTTMMRLLLDIIQASAGHASICGKRVALDASWKELTGSFIDSSFLVDFYTPEEYFDFIAEVYGIPKDVLQERLREYEHLMNGEILGTGKLLKSFSMGNRQKVGIIGAMVINPKFLVLDEPFNFLDPSSQLIVARLIRKMNEELGTTVLVSSHNMASINDICTRILLLDKGRILIDNQHVPGNSDPDLEAYFADVAEKA